MIGEALQNFMVDMPKSSCMIYEPNEKTLHHCYTRCLMQIRDPGSRSSHSDELGYINCRTQVRPDGEKTTPEGKNSCAPGKGS